MKVIMQVSCFMLNTTITADAETLGFQTCLHMTFHIAKRVIDDLQYDQLNLTLDVVWQVLQCVWPIFIYMI